MYKKEYNHTPKRKQARKAKNKGRMRENLMLSRAAKNKPCADCHKCYHYSLMEFDHRPGEDKKFNISEIIRTNKGRGPLLAEIAKCDVVCVLCHRVRTWNRSCPENERISL